MAIQTYFPGIFLPQKEYDLNKQLIFKHKSLVDKSVFSSCFPFFFYL